MTITTEEERWWLWKAPEGARYIGKRGIPRKDAAEKASGKCVYCKDIKLPGMLYAKHLDSPYAHVKIKSLDLSRAENVPGVVSIIRWDDPDFKNRWPIWNPLDDANPVFLPWLMDRAYFYGQPIGLIIVAESEEACDEALRLAKEDIEWEELPFNLNWEEYEKHPQAWPDYEEYSPRAKGKLEYEDFYYEFGNVEEGFKEADKVIEFTIRKSEEDVWAGVEGHVVIARWIGEHLEIWTNHQNLNMIRRYLSKELKIPLAYIEIHTPFKGAWFGGRTWLMQATEIVTALIAKKLGRPIKYIDNYSDFRGAEHHLGTYKFKVGFKKDGTITAVKIDTIYACRGFGLLLDPISKLLKSTKIPNVSLHSVYPLVNRNPTTCYKHGAPACTVVTMVINRVAAELGMDPTEVALKNDGCEGHDIEWIYDNIAKKQGFDTSRWSLKECIEIGKKVIGWDEKWHPPGTKKLPNGKYHGIGFTAMLEWAYKPPYRAIGAVGIRIESDGTVNVFGQRPEGGVAGDTAYCQVIADEIGVRLEDVVLKPTEYKGYILTPYGGSSGLMCNLIPIIKAARKAKEAILKYAALLPEFKGKMPEELDVKDGMIFEKKNPANKVPLTKVSSTHLISTCADAYPDVSPKDAPAMTRLAYFVEIEVDPETGKVDILNVVAVNDVGKVINIDATNAQQYGGVYMGMGRALTEAIYYDPLTGVKLNDNLVGYSVLLMNDIKNIECHLVETGLGYGPYGMAGCSEAPAAVTSTIAAPAIYNAIGKWIDDWPITPDKILKALGKA